MSFLKEVESFSKDQLRHVATVITRSDGKKFTETRSITGAVHLVVHEEEGLGYCSDLQPDHSVSPVLPGLLLAAQTVARNKSKLTEHGVTHILNVAAGLKNYFPLDYSYCHAPIGKEEEETIMKHYPMCEKFIDEALSAGGTVLLHCRGGKSRSVSIAIAYMMHKDKSLSVDEALESIRKTRPAADPNEVFFRQLKQLEQEIKQ